MTKFLILMGLPASGKTTWANNNYGNREYSRNSAIIVDLDNNKTSIGNFVNYYNHLSIIVLDGLFLTNKDVASIITEVLNSRKLKSKQFEIHFWKENREACLSNDVSRIKERGKNSAITIKNAILEKPDIDILRSLCGKDVVISVVEHEVYLKTEAEGFADKIGVESLSSDGCFRSARWSNGGTWCSYTGDKGTISPDSSPDFTKLDDILKKIAPNISYLDYKKICRDSVEIESSSSNDYYGGTEYYLNHKCDFNKLYNSLKELGYINDNSS
jgi:hypothetical protein